jgi:hypothetical protein
VLQAISIIVGVVSGISGLVLGILNYLAQRDSTRPRLRVRPRLISLIDRETKKTESNVAVMEVCNIGNVAVVGSSIGFLAKRKGEKGHLVVSPNSINGQGWPGKLPPGRAAILRMNLGRVSDPYELGRAFASTLVGDNFLSSRADLRKFAKELAELADDPR